MELNEKEKERIIAEEKVRFEAKKQLMQEELSKGWGWRRHGYGYGCHSHRCGGGFFKVLVLGLILFGLCHLWHRGAYGPCGYGAYPPQVQSQAPAMPPKN